jgi:glucose/arabinose dehydrogenase
VVKDSIGSEYETMRLVKVAGGLEHAWAVAFLPDGRYLVTERPGRMQLIENGRKTELEGVPEVFAVNQGGLLDVALSPNFESDRTIFWSYSEPREDGNATSVARGVLSSDRSRLEQVRVIFRARPTYDGTKHFGSRLVFGQDGMLYVTLGDRSDKPMRPQAQRLDSHMGKILRIELDGSIPADNPELEGARSHIHTWGHRNPQGLAFTPDGRLFSSEHGPKRWAADPLW